MTQSKIKEGGFCLNCDNRHGCKTEQPLCESLTLDQAQRWVPGKELMRRRGMLDKCRNCGHFRKCWGADAYRRALEVDRARSRC